MQRMQESRNSSMKSMTGYGRAEKTVENLDVLIEIKSVNHRYFEFSSRLPKAYGYLEIPLKNLIKEKVNRGKVEVSVFLYHPEGKKACVSVNNELAKGYVEALRAARNELNLGDDLTLSSLMQFSDIFNIQDVKEEEQQVIDFVVETASEALDSFIEMREKEGEALKKDISSKLDRIEELVKKVEEAAPSLTEKYFERLYTRLKTVLESEEFDQQRIITEAAVFSEKVAVDEETVRLESHISQMRGLLELNIPVGKKLDFIVQEMNREVNTIGSKAMDVEITKTVVDMKSEIEKIREQIQNVE